MGCSVSKLEESEAVALCRDSADLLLEAIRLRYDLADAHSDYIVSLQEVGQALRKFFDGSSAPPPRFHPSPVLTLPNQRKGDTLQVPNPRSRSHSGSHLHFDSSDFSEEEEGHLHSLGSSPFFQKQTPKTLVNLSKKGNAGPVTSYEMPPPASPGYSYGSPYRYPYSGFYGGAASNSTAPSSSKQPPEQPPPPPSPPQVSAWEFLNPFESYTSYYPNYPASQNSSDLREEEGIPDLEEDDAEIIKEAIVDQKHVSPLSSISSPDDVKVREMPEASRAVAEESVKVMMTEVPAAQRLVPQSRAAAEAVEEIREKFLGASRSCEAVSTILEVGKRPSRWIRAGGGPSKRIGSTCPSFSLKFWILDANEEPGEEDDLDAVALSSTLYKLFLWEKKLYAEVRAEEETRLMYDRKVRLLVRLDEKGAESDRIAVTQAKVKKLATKIGVAIQVVDTISRRINTLRDEELWPQLRELIQGLAKMWGALVVCHKSQLEVVVESMSLDAAATAQGDVAKELEFALLGWIGRFSSWCSAQKKFAMALNSWLMRIIVKEPEETADGLAPFSPGRIGAPPVFVICNQWSQAMERTSDVENAVEAMRLLASSVLQFWGRRHRTDLPVAAAGGKDQARLLRAREREEREISRAKERLDRDLVLVGNVEGLHPRKESAPGSLQESLKLVFDAMERLSESSVRIYEGLLTCSQNEQERYSRNIDG